MTEQRKLIGMGEALKEMLPTIVRFTTALRASDMGDERALDAIDNDAIAEAREVAEAAIARGKAVLARGGDLLLALVQQAAALRRYDARQTTLFDHGQ